MTVGDNARPIQAERGTAASSPFLLVSDPAGAGTGLILFPRTDALPAAWVGAVPAGLEPDDAAALLAAVRPCPLLPQHGEGWFGRPGLSRR
jgi:hypothetical protein